MASLDSPGIGDSQIYQQAAQFSHLGLEPKKKVTKLTSQGIAELSNTEGIWKTLYLLDVFHHHSLYFRDLRLDFSKLANFFRMISAVLHMLFQF